MPTPPQPTDKTNKPNGETALIHRFGNCPNGNNICEVNSVFEDVPGDRCTSRKRPGVAVGLPLCYQRHSHLQLQHRGDAANRAAALWRAKRLNERAFHIHRIDRTMSGKGRAFQQTHRQHGAQSSCLPVTAVRQPNFCRLYGLPIRNGNLRTRPDAGAPGWLLTGLRKISGAGFQIADVQLAAFHRHCWRWRSGRS